MSPLPVHMTSMHVAAVHDALGAAIIIGLPCMTLWALRSSLVSTCCQCLQSLKLLVAFQRHVKLSV
jgi:hypothetical protein